MQFVIAGIEIMNDKIDWLRSHCSVSDYNDGNRFVGFKINNGEPHIYFPLGYDYESDDKLFREDLLKLFSILNDFSEAIPDMLPLGNEDVKAFPLNSYVDVIKYYFEHGYYTEKEVKYSIKNNGKIHWGKTIKHCEPTIQSDFSLIYTNFVVRESTNNMDNLVSIINKFCVYESFEKVGWIFTSYVPPKVQFNMDIKVAIRIIKNKLLHTYSDAEKRLFGSMRKILEYIESDDGKQEFLYGTEFFEIVWEKMIDKVFGIRNKQEYFPKTKWLLGNGIEKIKYPLEPDSIMQIDDKVYVLDAKYYKYGVTGNPNHLPDSSSINKQITYGEFVEKHKDINDESLYNAFLMPFNANNNPFKTTDVFYNVGEAVGDWKCNNKRYERIQGIVIDTKTLINTYCRRSKEYNETLAMVINSKFL